MFLKEFAENTPWVHLDIAGTHGSTTRNRTWRRVRLGRRFARWYGLLWIGAADRSLTRAGAMTHTHTDFRSFWNTG